MPTVNKRPDGQRVVAIQRLMREGGQHAVVRRFGKEEIGSDEYWVAKERRESARRHVAERREQMIEDIKQDEQERREQEEEQRLREEAERAEEAERSESQQQEQDREQREREAQEQDRSAAEDLDDSSTTRSDKEQEQDGVEQDTPDAPDSAEKSDPLATPDMSDTNMDEQSKRRVERVFEIRREAEARKAREKELDTQDRGHSL